MKICTRCNTEKPLSDFQKRKASKDGFTSSCKNCLSEYDKQRAMLPHRVKAREEYQKTDAGKLSVKKSKNKWQKNNPIKRGANVIVGNAVRDGKLIKPDNCESCGNKPDRIHGHHCDYAKPLDVMWLCSKCHNDWHEANGEAKNG